MKTWLITFTCFFLFSISTGMASEPPAPEEPPAETGSEPVPQPPREAPIVPAEPAAEVEIAPVQPVPAVYGIPAFMDPEPDPADAAKPSGTVFELSPGWKLKLNGYVHLNILYTSAESFSIDSPAFVFPDRENDFKNSNHGAGLAFSARDTRLRMELAGPKAWQFDPTAVIEMDFWGNLPASGTSIRQSQMRMRLAYMEMKRNNLILRFGNDWMVAAPQFATTFEPFNLWAQGNLWMRVPQAKVMYNIGLPKTFRIETAAMVGQAMGGDNPRGEQVRHTGIGEMSLVPLMQARLGLGFQIGNARFSTLGVSGSYQKLDFRGSTQLNATEYANLVALKRDAMDSWFVAFDGQLNWEMANVKFQLTGEYHYGQATGMFWGGILQSFQFVRMQDEIVDVTPVKSIGFFSDLKVLFPCGFWAFGGMGRNVVDEDDIVIQYSPVKNTIFYGGVALNKGPMTFGVGGGYLETHYISTEDPKNAIIVQGFTSITF